MRTSTILLVLFACAISASNSMKLLGASGLGSVPCDINTCEDTPDSELQGFQATWDNTPAKGSTISAHLDATTIADMTIKTISVQTTYGGNVVSTNNYDYGSKKFAAGDNMHWDLQQYLPGFTPSGAYTLRITFVDEAGASHGCAAVNLTL